ncbi:MAG: response regulator [Deltaproteobacteria bacterium]|nr:response regulator [Deltaproteobacteria bacterium]
MSNSKKVLVVEDDPDCLDQVSLLLERAGFEVIRAQGRAQGEEALMRTRPDLAVLDLMMEEMDSGFVLCHEIKRLYPNTPVIVLTAVGSETGMDFKTTAGDAQSWIKAEVMLDKPVRPEQLDAAIKKLLAE